MTFEANENHPDVRRPRVRTVTQHSVEGRMRVEVAAPEVYAGNCDIHFRWGPIFLVLKDKEAARSFLEGLGELKEIVDHLYPDLDQALREQRLARLRESQDRESPATRALRNGTLSPIERDMAEARLRGETSDAVGRSL